MRADRVLLAGVSLFLALSACAPAQASAALALPGSTQVRITRVVDGDTVHAGQLTIRLLGVDTPETKKPKTPVECGGPEASAFAHRLLDGQTVVLSTDPTQQDRDRYGRSLRYIRLADGRDYSLEAVRAGMARVYTYAHKPVSRYRELEAAQSEAMAAHRGLWSCPNPKPGD